MGGRSSTLENGGKPGLAKAGFAAASAGSGSGGRRVRNISRKQARLTLFTRQLATLLSAKVPLLRALETLLRQEQDSRFRRVIQDLADTVRTGGALSEGMAQYPAIFNHLYISMVRAGEAGSIQDQVLQRLAAFMEKNEKIKKKAKSAMAYPCILICFTLAILVFLMTFVVPRFEAIFTEMLRGVPLPAITQVIIQISEWMRDQFLLLALLVVGLVVLGQLALRNAAIAYYWDRVLLLLPGIGNLKGKIGIARFTRTLGTLDHSGVPLLDALRISREVVSNRYIERAIDNVHDRVRDGESIAAPLERSGVFPHMVPSMIQVGEETGCLAEMLERIADTYDEDVDNAVNALTSMIEPVMIIFLAVVVGIIVLALILPIMTIIQNLNAGI